MVFSTKINFLLFRLSKKLIFILVRVVQEFYDHQKMLENSEINLISFLMLFEKNQQNEFGGRFIYIGLEMVAVAAASVVELPPRCSN